MSCTCFFVPKSVLERLANDKTLAAELRRAAFESSLLSDLLRQSRLQHGAFISASRPLSAQLEELAAQPESVVFDANHTHTLPGKTVPNPGSSSDPSAKRAYTQAARVAEFYQTIFKRNSVDNAGATLVSSVHYARNYNNAMWNGTQMVYGDGDGKIFIDFTGGNDVIGHELTHGVTQYTLQLGYEDDAGGLNESLSDCFGSMFRQWEAKQTSQQADWLIGSDIIGPVAKERNVTCLRNMANPADPRTLSPQPAKYSQLSPGMDPHFTSGPPNLAFCTACKGVPGNSWDTVGQVWYHVMVTAGPKPQMTMADFAGRTRQAAVQLFEAKPEVAKSVDAGWKLIGL
ncbi:MAG TPA: M4 family metallopeptidase [Polyangia bacterium]|nr:M4 family metallopeptidase [Polyangia bacterium]